ncbi:MAG: hypothetical protein H0U98_12140 [Alphaproteobacteria bacterium]|nr:hypothetical protein [Alphaproteobacteria bacterium]
MVRLPVVPENYLDDGQPSDQQNFAPPYGGGGGAPVAGPKNPIGPVEGYPEDGKHAWRAGNDDVIVEAAKGYNARGAYLPGNAEYMTPKLMKSWMMRESGGARRHSRRTRSR